MQIKSIEELLDILSRLKRQINNLSNDSDVFLRVTKSLDGWEDKLKTDAEMCIREIKRFINDLIVRYQTLYKDAQILITEYRELYLKNNLGGII